jgi:hypothetical protein
MTLQVRSRDKVWNPTRSSSAAAAATVTARCGDAGVNAVAVGVLPDRTSVIVSGGSDGAVRVRRLADGTPIVPPLELPESVQSIAVHGEVIVTAAGTDIAVHQPALPRLPCV